MSAELRRTPWSAYSGEDTNGWFVIHDADGDEIGSTDGGFEESEARMFAAAPDMADALKAVLVDYGIRCGPDDALRPIGAQPMSIRKAMLALARSGVK